MTEVQIRNYHDIKFTRDTKIDSQKDDIVTRTIFAQYDTDKSGDFNDTEWAFYERITRNIDREPTVFNENIVNYYEKKFIKLSRQFDTLTRNWDKLDWSILNELDEFYNQHPEIKVCASNKYSDIPKDAFEFNAEPWGIGVYDEEEGSFTGEIATYGYIVGLDSLSKEERKEFLRIFKEVNKLKQKADSYREQFNKLSEKEDRIYALCDMAENGMINAVGSKEFEDQMYQQYLNIRNTANPFYKEIQEIEKALHTLRLKAEKTTEDLQQIEQYNIQLEQLYVASSQWSIADVQTERKEDGNNFQLSLNPVQINHSSETDENKNEQHTVSNTSSLVATYNSPNFDFSSTTSLIGSFTTSGDEHLSGSISQTLNINANLNGAILNSTSNTNLTRSLLTHNQDIKLSYRNMSFVLNESISNDYSGGTTFKTGIGAGYKSNEIEINANALFEDNIASFNLFSKYNYNKKFNDNLSLTLTPQITTNYNTGAESITLSPIIKGNLEYSRELFSANLNTSVSCSSSLYLNGSPTNTNYALSLGGNIKYDNFSANANYVYMNNSSESSNTYGFGVGYQYKKWNFGLNASLSESDANNMNNVTVSMAYNF